MSGLLGDLALREDDYAQAQDLYEESISLLEETGQNDPWTCVKLGYALLRQGDATGARSMFEEGQKLFKRAGSNTIGIVYALEGLASLAVMQGQPERAVQLFAWADVTREAIEDTRRPVEQVDVDRDFIIIRAQLDEAAFAAAYAAGRAMTLEQAVAYALEELAAEPLKH